jgi:hypothetical protein
MGTAKEVSGMPKDAESGQVRCLNGHGSMREERPPGSDGYGLYSVRHDPDERGVVTPTTIIFSVRLYVCDVCGYIEFYNDEGPAHSPPATP